VAGISYASRRGCAVLLQPAMPVSAATEPARLMWGGRQRQRAVEWRSAPAAAAAPASARLAYGGRLRQRLQEWRCKPVAIVPPVVEAPPTLGGRPGRSEQLDIDHVRRHWEDIERAQAEEARPVEPEQLPPPATASPPIEDGPPLDIAMPRRGRPNAPDLVDLTDAAPLPAQLARRRAEEVLIVQLLLMTD